MTIESFRNRETEDVAYGRKNKRTLKLLPSDVHFPAYKKLVFLNNIETLASLRAWPGLKLEPLRGDRKEQWSIRINDKYRICFRFNQGQAYDVEITDYH